MEIERTTLDSSERMEIEGKALELMNSIGYSDNSDSIDIIDIAHKMGFAVGNAILKDDMDGFIIVDESKKEILGIKTDKLIGVNSERELSWKRFIIAHEIAHYVLHYSPEKDNGMYAHRDHKKGKNKQENEADFFAANLLMPRDKFVSKYKEFKAKGLSLEETILLLADKFIVTQITAQRRIEELGLE